MKQYQQAVHVERPDLEIDTHVASSEDDLDVNINNNDQENQFKERPPKAHSTKAQAVAGPSGKVVMVSKKMNIWMKKLTYPTVNNLVSRVKKKGHGCLLFKRDFKEILQTNSSVLKRL